MPGENLVFAVQAGFSFSTLLFCVIMLATDKDPTYYLPILTSIIGYWLPAPQYRNVPAQPTLAPPGGVRRFPSLQNIHNVFLRKQPQLLEPTTASPEAMDDDSPSAASDPRRPSEDIDTEADNALGSNDSPSASIPELQDPPELCDIVVVSDQVKKNDATTV